MPSIDVGEKVMGELQVQRARKCQGRHYWLSRISRAELEVVIKDLAAAKRVPGRSRRQGYADFIAQDRLGLELYRLLLKAPAPRQ
jgi:hypothetical protein